MGRTRTTEDEKLPGSDHLLGSLYLHNILHIHEGHCGVVARDRDFGSRSLRKGSRLPRSGTVFMGMALHMRVHATDPGVKEYLIYSDCLRV